MTDDELDQRLRDSILSEEVNTSRVAAAVHAEIQPRPRHVRGWAVAAAALIATIAASTFSYRTYLREKPLPAVCAAAVDDHQREIVNGEPRPWLTELAAIESLGEKQSVPASAIAALGTTGYRLERARLCLLKKQIFLHLVYTKDGAEYSVFLRSPNGDASFSQSVRGTERAAFFETKRVAAVFVSHDADAQAFARAGAQALQGLPS